MGVIILVSCCPGFERYLEGESLFALWLPPDDDDTDGAEQSQNDDGHHDACVSVPQLLETVGQDDAEHGDKNGCRETRRTECYSGLWWQDLLYNLHLFYPVILTNNSSGGVDDGPRGVCRALSTRGEEQLDGKRLSERLLIQLHAGLVAAVPSTYGHLLPFHQLHQLLRLAG